MVNSLINNLNIETKKRIIAGLITLTIISIFVITGSAQAFIAELNIDNENFNRGDIGTFSAMINLGNNEVSDIQEILLSIKGPKEVLCRFNIEGNIINGCEGITIRKVTGSDLGYSYGYGYSYGPMELKYEISLDTNKFDLGVYSTELSFNSNGQNFKIKGKDIRIFEKKSTLKSPCSIRSSSGNIKVNNNIYEDIARLSLYIPIKSSDLGEGYLLGQDKRKRMEYDFNIDYIIESNTDQLIAAVSGKYREGRYGSNNENSILTYDIKNSLISIKGENINVENMHIDLRRGCEF